MGIEKKLSSKNFFVFNLVIIGIIFGFSLAFFSFSCSTPGGGNIARAQEVVIPREALAVAEGLQTAFNAVAEKTLPSVVEVKTVSIQRRQNSPNFNGNPWEFFFGPRGDSQENPGREFRSQGIGSGIIVRNQSGTYYVLTNNHVIDRTSEITIAARNGNEFPAEIVGRDVSRDLAVLSFKTPESFPVADLGDSDAVKVGDWAIAMGNPLGVSFSVTMGIISAVGRIGGPGGNINDFIQTDASINQGNSGGPLVNIRGEVIGINTWITSNAGGGSVGLGFAIPINNAIRVIEEIISSGSVSDGWLGVSLVDPTREMSDALNLAGRRGALALQVFLGSPAYSGGIRAGDFITHVDGVEIRGSNHLTQSVRNIKPGDRAVFRAVRDGASVEFTVRIDIRTDDAASDSRKLWPGLMVIPLNEDTRSRFDLPENADGLYVTQVISETPAAIVGLQRGDRITAVNGRSVSDLAAFYRVLRDNAGSELWFSFIRSDSSLESLRFRQ